MNEHAASSPPVRYERIAGLAYLLVIILGVISAGLIDPSLVVQGNHAATARNIANNGALFRLSVVAALILYAGVLVLAWALYIVLRPINERLALLALILRTAEGILGAATAILSLAALAALQGAGGASGIREVQALVGLLLETRTAALDIVLLFVGLGGGLFCYLFLVSRLIPRVLAAWGIVTYASMVGLGVLSLLWPGHPALIEQVLYGAGTLFEVCIGLWLLVKGTGNRVAA